jgi:hypothetical protein
MHLTVPIELIAPLQAAGWMEPHPTSLRPEWPDTIVMLYAPRNDDELALATAVLRASWQHASAGSESLTSSGEEWD